ncbi:MAG: alcohol dehydrogenase catalytic domain-containing protein [Pirellulaceae bacterium]
MLAVRFEGGRLHVADQPLPEPSTGEVRVRVHLAGICSTDLEITKGYFGFQGTLGHEFVGTVDAPARSFWNAKRVVCSINFVSPKDKLFDRFGFEHHPERSVLGILNRDGAMAEYVCVPEANLFEVPESVSDQQAVFTEPLAAALQIGQQVDLKTIDRACVIGPGRLGILIAACLRQTKVQTTVIGRNERSLHLPRKWGLTTTQIDDLVFQKFPLVVDATGSPAGLQLAMSLTEPRGTLVLKSTFAGKNEVDLTPIVVDEIRLLGSRCGPFEKSLEVLDSQNLSVEDLIDGEYELAQAERAFAHASQPGVRKILLHMP